MFRLDPELTTGVADTADESLFSNSRMNRNFIFTFVLADRSRLNDSPQPPHQRGKPQYELTFERGPGVTVRDHRGLEGSVARRTFAGIDRSVLVTNAELQRDLETDPIVQFAHAIDTLCNGDGCLVSVLKLVESVELVVIQERRS